MIDNEPLYDETAEGTNDKESRQSQFTNESKKVNERLKTNIKTMDQSTDSIDFGENTKEERKQQIDKDKEALKNIQGDAVEIAKGLEGIKDFERYYKEAKIADRFKDIKYVSREEDPELKQEYESRQEKLDNLSESLVGKIDGEIDLDLHGNLSFRSKADEKPKEGIQGTGTYVLRDGKLVEGKGMVREQATFSNWYCSNADPEDL